ncbi:16S rRNA (uracil(1498)-N(3))-methyltransferase [Aurantibacter sp.]|uniref:16S rRNA (uracil(1498)-N(3))-methyltransferase n=1 Tax=Aurantibacter sp. TaxID=2807103 RepID=UPI0035C824A3
MQLFYSTEITDTNNTFIFSKEESKHIVKVLRKKEQDVLFVTNGKGSIFKCEINSANDKKCSVSILETTTQKASKYSLHLAVAPTKMNDRYEWFLEKATEIGITEITPIICDHSERKIIKPERFEKILESAMKQSLSAYKPILNESISFKNFVAETKSQTKFIAHCEETDKKSLKKELKPNQDYLILIGPEGDFSKKEIDLALKHNFIPVTLGETRLRTETAAIVACHSVAFVNE